MDGKLNKPGARTKRTPETAKRIIDLLKLGNYRDHAYTAAGISHDTFYKWLKADPAFSEAVEKAEAEAIAFHMSQIIKASREGTWQASAWFLERKLPDRFGRQDRRPDGPDRQEIIIKWAEDEQ